MFACVLLTGCGPKFFNSGFLDELEAEVGQSTNNSATTTFFQITNVSPTNSPTLDLNYGPISGSYDQYCIQENQTNVTSCAWIAGTVPATYAPTTTDGNVVLSLWLRSGSNPVSNRVDSNTVEMDQTAPSIASFTVTNNSPTNDTTYDLTFGAVTGTYVDHCILENNTDVSDCTWTNAPLPAGFAVSATQNAKVLSLWLRDSAGNVSARVPSNSVTLDTTSPTVSLTSHGGGQVYLGGTNSTVTWTATDGSGIAANSILIEVSSNGGTSWSSVATNEANDGTYQRPPVFPKHAAD